MNETFSESAITNKLRTKVFGSKLLYLPVISSTMDVARQEAQNGAEEGTLVIANVQTAGRGRLKRTWLSPGGNIALSIVLRPDITALPRLVMMASLSVARSIQQLTDLKPQIKWPNDVLINGKKVSGILIENELRGGKLSYAVVGIGINVNLAPDKYADISSIATSISQEMGKEVSRLDLLNTLLTEFEALYLSIPDNNQIFQQWRSNLVTLGKAVTVKFMSGDAFDGVAEDVDSEGNLLVRRTDGEIINVVAGDVTLRR